MLFMKPFMRNSCASLHQSSHMKLSKSLGISWISDVIIEIRYIIFFLLMSIKVDQPYSSHKPFQDWVKIYSFFKKKMYMNFIVTTNLNPATHWFIMNQYMIIHILDINNAPAAVKPTCNKHGIQIRIPIQILTTKIRRSNYSLKLYQAPR